MGKSFYTTIRAERCAECRKQYVDAAGTPVCTHHVAEGVEVKKICRRCWGKYSTRIKYKGLSVTTVYV